MKRLLKKLLRSAWRAAGPIHRPLLRKAHALLVQANRDALADSPLADQVRADLAAAHDRVLPPIHRQLEETAASARTTMADLDLLLNGMVREVARLQMQVEVLQDTIDAAVRPTARLARTPEPGRDHRIAS